jgi:hypothetical protein
MLRKTWLIITLMIALAATDGFAAQGCIPREELKDKHVVTYLAYNDTIRGCVVSSNFFTQQHKKGRGRLSRIFIIEICEGEPRTSPRVGDSFEICAQNSKIKPEEPPQN